MKLEIRNNTASIGSRGAETVDNPTERCVTGYLIAKIIRATPGQKCNNPSRYWGIIFNFSPDAISPFASSNHQHHTLDSCVDFVLSWLHTIV